MENTAKFRPLLEMAAKQFGTTPEALLDRLLSGDLTGALTPQQQSQLASLAADPSALSALLARPEIRTLLTKRTDQQ